MLYSRVNTRVFDMVSDLYVANDLNSLKLTNQSIFVFTPCVVIGATNWLYAIYFRAVPLSW